MGYAESNGGPYQRIDTSPVAPRPQTRYGGLADPSSGMDHRLGLGLGALGESDINQYNALVTSTTAAVNAAKAALQTLNQEVQVASITPGVDTSSLAVVNQGVQDLSSKPAAILAEIAAKGPGKFGKNDCGPNYCTQPLAAIKQIAPQAEQLTNSVATLRAQFNAWKTNVLGSMQAAQKAAADAAARAQADAAAAQKAAADAAALRQQDTSTVNGALTKATAFMGQGNYAGALAVLQAQSVIDAASRIGRSSDLDTASAAVAYQQSQVNQQQTAMQQQQALCAAKGGTWNGTFCDMSAAQTAAQKAAEDAANAKVDTAIGQSSALAAAGNYRGALLVLSGAMGAANAANRGTDVQLAMADVQQQQQDAARAAQQQQETAARAAQELKVGARIDAAITQANTYAADGAFDVALSVLQAAMADAAMINRASDVTAAQTAIQAARRASLLPKPAPDMATAIPAASSGGTDPAVLAILQSILAMLQGGGGGGAMASSVPGGAMSIPGAQISAPPQGFQANTGNYADFGPETF